MNRLGIMAYGAAIAGIALVLGPGAFGPGSYFYETHSGAMCALGMAGWGLATVGPLMLSLCIWRLARASRRPWMLHGLFIPAAFMMDHIGGRMLFFAADVPDGDSVEGYMLVPAFGVLLCLWLVHGVSLVWLGVARGAGDQALSGDGARRR